jgi:uncharacterized membrane protein YheB (UPF0754 family)
VFGLVTTEERFLKDTQSWGRDPKSTITNLSCLALIGLGLFVLPDPIARHVLIMGMFGFSGAITNWLAVHMLFERVPFLYGSGIIPLKFESFKASIYKMMMEQFFSERHIDRFLEHTGDHKINVQPVLDNLDYDEIFQGFLQVVQQSKFGGMLAMFGGARVLDSLKPVIEQVLREKLSSIVSKPRFQNALHDMLRKELSEDWQGRISGMVSRRLGELTPKMVKEIVQNMMRSHLGWLVIWGGVFGCLLGLISSFLPSL